MIRLHMLILSPIFPLLLSFIIFIAYKIIDGPLALCDNKCSPLLIEQLKDNLAEEINKSSRICKNIKEFAKIIEEIKESSDLNLAQKEYNQRKFASLQEMLIKSIEKSNEIELSIRKIQPL
jgi:hypothetical protein